MKNLFLTIVFFLFLLLIGCNENQITQPIQESVLQKTDDPSYTGTIKLKMLLQDPLPIGNSYYMINGEIQYQHSLEFVDPIPPNPQYYVSLNLSLNADFTYFCSVCPPSPDDQPEGFISEISEEIVPMPYNDPGVMLEKTYTIEGREDGMVLKCRFSVTTSDIRLIGMWLEINNETPEINYLN